MKKKRDEMKEKAKLYAAKKIYHVDIIEAVATDWCESTVSIDRAINRCSALTVCPFRLGGAQSCRRIHGRHRSVDATACTCDADTLPL